MNTVFQRLRCVKIGMSVFKRSSLAALSKLMFKIFAHICICIFIDICICVCICVCTCVCICICICTSKCSTNYPCWHSVLLGQGGSPPLHETPDKPPQELPPGKSCPVGRNWPKEWVLLLWEDLQVQLQPEKAPRDFARGSNSTLSHLWNPAEGPEDLEYTPEECAREDSPTSLSWTGLHYDCSELTSLEGSFPFPINTHIYISGQEQIDAFFLQDHIAVVHRGQAR